MILRYAVPDRSAAAIINTFMYEEGILNDNDMSRVIDRNLLRRWKAKVYKDHIPTQVDGLYFDGKKDLTKQPGGKFEKEEHITIVSEPGTKFITHVTCNGKTDAATISDKIISKIEITEDISEIKVIFWYLKINPHIYLIMSYTYNIKQVVGCGGTNVKTGKHNGIIRQIEKRANKKFQWSVSSPSIIYFE